MEDDEAGSEVALQVRQRLLVDGCQIVLVTEADAGGDHVKRGVGTGPREEPATYYELCPEST